MLEHKKGTWDLMLKNVGTWFMKEPRRERERSRLMARDGPAQEAESWAEGHQVESRTPQASACSSVTRGAQLKPLSASFLPWRSRATRCQRAFSSAG